MPPPWSGPAYEAMLNLMLSSDTGERDTHRGPSFDHTNVPPPSFIPCTPALTSPKGNRPRFAVDFDHFLDVPGPRWDAHSS